MSDEEDMADFNLRFVRVMISIRNALVVEGKASPDDADLGDIGIMVARCLMTSDLGREPSDAELEATYLRMAKSMKGGEQ